MILQTCEFKIRSFDITYQKQKRRITPIRVISIALRKVWESFSTTKKMLKFWWINNMNFANISSEVHSERVW